MCPGVSTGLECLRDFEVSYPINVPWICDQVFLFGKLRRTDFLPVRLKDGKYEDEVTERSVLSAVSYTHLTLPTICSV